MMILVFFSKSAYPIRYSMIEFDHTMIPVFIKYYKRTNGQLDTLSCFIDGTQVWNDFDL